MRNKLLIALACSALLSLPALGGALSDKEATAVKADVQMMLSAVQKGDIDTILKLTHESIYKIGDRATIEKETRDTLKQFETLGLKFVDVQIGAPTPTYPAGEEDVCFVPTVILMEIQDKKVRSTGYMVAIRRRASNEWRYLDGAGFRDNPKLLRELLPKLDASAVPPPNKMEML